MDDNDIPELNSEMLTALLNMNAMLDPLIQACHGYKRKLINEGFNEMEASAMTIHYYVHIMNKMFAK